MANGLANVTSVSELQDILISSGKTLADESVIFGIALVKAILVFLLGWVIAIIISRIFGRLLKIIKFEQFLKEQKVNAALGSVVISNVLTKILYYSIILMFLTQAFEILQLQVLKNFMDILILNYIPAMIGGALLIVAAALIGEFVKNRIIDVGSRSATVNFVGRAAKALIIFLGIMSALETTTFGVTIIRETFLALSTAVFFGFALAFAIAFGLGAQGEAKEVVKGLRKKFKV